MDPVRRVLFLMLFASVLAAEPTSAHALAPEKAQIAADKVATRWIQRLAITLHRAVQSAPPEKAPPRRLMPVVRHASPQVRFVHASLEPHAFRLPPPASL